MSRAIRPDELRGFLGVADAMRPKSATDTMYSIPGVRVSSSTTRSFALDTLYYFPFWVTEPVTVDRLSLDVAVAAAAGGVTRMGIYRADQDAQPGELVVDGGEVTTDTEGTKNSIINASLSSDRYLLALLQGTAAPTLGCVRADSGGLFNSNGFTEGVVWEWGMRVSQVYGALPDPGTVWDTTFSGNNTPEWPIMLRIASFS